jgi:hypothetical protein
MFELVHLVLYLLEMAERCESRLMHRRTRLKLNVLVQETEPHCFRPDDVAAICIFISGDETKYRTLSRAVATDKTDVLPRVYLERGAAQDILHAIGLVNI